MKLLAPSAAAVLLVTTLGSALAQVPTPEGSHDGHHSSTASTAPGASTAPEAPDSTPADHSDLSEGEITRWDPRTLRVTMRHGEIKNLGMPPMTMVFRIKDASMLAPFQPGDKVRFRVEQQSAGYFITRMEAPR